MTIHIPDWVITGAELIGLVAAGAVLGVLFVFWALRNVSPWR